MDEPKIKKCNILILGKTGVGKSSLINALVGEDVAAKGVGKPVTEKGIHPYITSFGDYQVTVYDSQGIECGDDITFWMNELEKEKEKHSYKHSAGEWFHCIIYCIDAAGGRIEDIDLQIIQAFIRFGYNLTVALTKCDLCAEEDENSLKQVLLSNCPDLSQEKLIGVCSGKQIRGRVSEPFGIFELKQAVLTSYLKLLVHFIPKRIVFLLQEEVKKFVASLKGESEKTVGQLLTIVQPWWGIFPKRQNPEQIIKACEHFQRNIFPEMFEACANLCIRECIPTAEAFNFAFNRIVRYGSIMHDAILNSIKATGIIGIVFGLQIMISERYIEDFKNFMLQAISDTEIPLQECLEDYFKTHGI